MRLLLMILLSIFILIQLNIPQNKPAKNKIETITKFSPGGGQFGGGGAGGSW